MDEKKLLSDYEPLIRKIAGEYYSYSNSPSLSYEDFLQDARLGFITALRKFDFNKGTAFSSYIDYGIRLEMRKALKTKSYLVHFPSYRIEQISKIKKAKKINESRSYILEHTGLKEKDMDECEKIGYKLNPFYLDEEVNDDEDMTFLAFERTEDFAPSLIDEMMVDELEKKIEQLDEKEQYVIKSVSGSFGFDKKRFNQISLELGISSRNIGNTYKNALEKLKKAI